MESVSDKKLANRWHDEELALHWRVDETEESLVRLLFHLEVRSNFKPYFEEALTNLNLDEEKKDLLVADIGAGVCWTSCILAQHPKIKYIYASDPSANRLKHAEFALKHFKAIGKVKIIKGTFLEPRIPEKVDLILLCGSLHHCYDEQLAGLFINIKELLKPGGRVLIANEHYVNWIWSFKRLASYIKHYRRRKELFYFPLGKLRACHPFDGEHWRTRKELNRIFKENGFIPRFFIHKADLCKDKPSLYERIGWRYYHVILEPEMAV